MRFLWAAIVGAAALTVAGCDGRSESASNDELKRGLEQLNQGVREQTGQNRDIASASKSSADILRQLTARMDSVERTLSAGFAQQKRGALQLSLETVAVCDNDEVCTNTARGICNKINYPNAVALRYTPGVRPTLQTVVCFD